MGNGDNNVIVAFFYEKFQFVCSIQHISLYLQCKCDLPCLMRGSKLPHFEVKLP